MATPRTVAREVSAKQAEALTYLRDDITEELVYGGGVGGGKSKLGCMFAIDMSIKYNNIRGAICRKELKRLKDTTLLTLFEQMQADGLKDGKDYVYNQQNNIITFPQTGSIIYLLELDYYPSDPNYDRLGSYEITWNFIDEAQQIQQKAKDVMRTRIRYKVEENGLIPKQLMTCNPNKEYLYTEYYLPAKRGELPRHKKFLQSLVSDNPFVGDVYINSLKKQPLEIRERLLYGNWEYDDDPTRLMSFDSIQDIFTNKVPAGKDKYIICDVARMGGDRIVITYWEGLSCQRIAAYKRMPTVPDPNDPTKPSTAGIINEWRAKYQVPLSHVLVDEDGVGGGVKDYLGCKGFLNGGKPMRKENYTNLKTQCYYELAKNVNLGKISIKTENLKVKQLIIEELEQVKNHGADKDGKLEVTPKDTMKKKLGRSPDFADTLMMRMYFEFAPKPQIMFI